MVKDFKALNLTICLWIFSPCVILLTFGLNKYNLFRITDFFFSFIICLDEKFRKELHQKLSLAVKNAFLRKLFFPCLVLQWRFCLCFITSHVFFEEMFKITDICFYTVVMLVQSEIFFILWCLLSSHSAFFPPRLGWKSGFSYCESGKQLS